MNSQEIRGAVSIAVLFLVRMLGLFTILPVLPLVADQIDASTPLLVGIAIGVYGLSQAVLQIPFGLMSDRFGRKRIIVIGLILFVLGSLVAAWSSDIYGIILGRLLQGCGAIASTLFALTSDLTRVEHRSKAMAIIGIGIASSFGLALVLGPLLAAYAGFSGLFLFSAVAGTLGIVICWKVIPTPAMVTTNLNTAVVTQKLKATLMDRSLLPVNVGVLFLHYFLTSSFLVFPLLLRHLGIADASHSVYYLGILVISAVLMAPFVWLSDKKGQAKPVMLSMIVLLSLALAGLGASEVEWLILGAMVLFFVAFNLLEVALPAYVSRVVAAGSRGTGMGVYSTFQFGGTFLGGVVGGAILHFGDISYLMYVNALLCLFWFGLSTRISDLSGIESRTVSLSATPGGSDNKLLEGLSSLPGVLDVVLIEEEGVAYLKIDSMHFNEQELQELRD
jgi:MFS family permease